MWRNGIWQSPQNRRPIRSAPYKVMEDMQNQVPFGWCCSCGREVYGFEQFVCEECERWSGYEDADKM